MPTITEQLADLATDLAAAASLYDLALDNLDDMQPGFPSSTPGASPATAGNPAVYPDPCTHPLGRLDNGELVHCGHEPRPCPLHDTPVRLSIVEQLADATVFGRGDEARADLEQLRYDIDLLLKTGQRVTALLNRWGTQPAKPKIDPKAKHAWCTNHLLIEVCVDAYRSGLCRWCYDIWRAERRRPSARLMLLKHSGVSITRKLIRDDHPARRKKKGYTRPVVDPLATGKRQCPAPKCTEQIDGARYACRDHYLELPATIGAALTRARHKISDNDPAGVTEFLAAAELARHHWRTTASAA